jgi:hypothetical protein
VGIVGVLALAAGWMIWRDRSTPGPTTTLLAAPTTTPEPSTTVAISTTFETSTTATTEEQREAEVEQILTDLWFGWFDAIYRKDAEALWQVAANENYYTTGIEAMEALDFIDAPDMSAVEVDTQDVLLDREDCLVAFSEITARFIQGSPTSTQVNVLWFDPRYGWRFASAWRHSSDLWQADCDEVVREITP